MGIKEQKLKKTPDEQGDYVGAFLCRKKVGQPDPSIEEAIESHVACEKFNAISSGMISEDAKNRIDFLSGVSLLLCRIANINNGVSEPPYPVAHDVLGDLADYYAHIKEIYPDLSAITCYHALVCGFFCHDEIPSQDKRH